MNTERDDRQIVEEMKANQREINWRNESLADADYVAEYQGDGWTDEQVRGYHKYVRELLKEITQLERTRTALYAERVALDRQTRIGDE